MKLQVAACNLRLQGCSRGSHPVSPRRLADALDKASYHEYGINILNRRTTKCVCIYTHILYVCKQDRIQCIYYKVQHRIDLCPPPSQLTILVISSSSPFSSSWPAGCLNEAPKWPARTQLSTRCEGLTGFGSWSSAVPGSWTPLCETLGFAQTSEATSDFADHLR